MKLYIDKHGGLHYHKPECRIVQGKPVEGTVFPRYEPIERQLRRIDVSAPYKEYANIIVDGRRYRICPFCFGGRR